MNDLGASWWQSAILQRPNTIKWTRKGNGKIIFGLNSLDFEFSSMIQVRSRLHLPAILSWRTTWGECGIWPIAGMFCSFNLNSYSHHSNATGIFSSSSGDRNSVLHLTPLISYLPEPTREVTRACPDCAVVLGGAQVGLGILDLSLIYAKALDCNLSLV